MKSSRFLFALILTLFGQNANCLRWYSWYGQTHDNFMSKFNDYVDQDYIPVWINGYSNDDKIRYTGIFRQNVDNKIWKAYINMTTTSLQKKVDDFKADDYMPIQVSGYPALGSSRFTALWIKDKNAPKWSIRWGLTASGLQTAMDEKIDEGFRVVSLSGYEYRGSPRYVAVFVKVSGPAWLVKYGMTRSRLNEYMTAKMDKGYLPKWIQGYEISGSGKTYYTVLLEKPIVTFPLIHEVSAGYNLESINGYIRNRQFRYAAIWTKRVPATTDIVNVSSLPRVSHDGYLSRMLSENDQNRITSLIHTFLRKWNIPGASVAIGKNEKLVYANGFGYADVKNRKRVNTSHVFRIASLSKPITSAAILKLVENAGVTTNDYALGSQAWLNHAYPDSQLTANEKAIRVKHLLRHTSGGWPNDNDDPLFQMEHLDKDDLLDWAFRNQEVPNVPGTQYAYSNFGYFLLGRIIEKVSGMDYEDYVTQNILGPMGISNVFIGSSGKAELRTDETQYYRQGDPGLPYQINVPRLDSCAGWVMTPRNLLKFLSHVDKFSSVPDYLSSASLRQMSTGSPVNRKYGMGWGLQNGGPNWNHLGTLPGTSSFLKRIESGKKAFAIVLNARKKGDVYESALVQLMWDIVDNMEYWPDGVDL